MKHESYENREDDHQLKQLLIVKQILLVSTVENVQRTVWRICRHALGFKWLNCKYSTIHQIIFFWHTSLKKKEFLHMLIGDLCVGEIIQLYNNHSFIDTLSKFWKSLGPISQNGS